MLRTEIWSKWCELNVQMLQVVRGLGNIITEKRSLGAEKVLKNLGLYEAAEEVEKGIVKVAHIQIPQSCVCPSHLVAFKLF